MCIRDRNIIEHLDEIQSRIKFPNTFKSFAKTALKTSKIINDSKDSISAIDVYEILEATDAFRSPEYFSLIMEFHNLADADDRKIKIIIDAFYSFKDIAYDEESFQGLERDTNKKKIRSSYI